MPTKQQILSALNAGPTVPIVLVDDQDVSDIIRYLKVKHVECERYYDKIAKFFEEDDLYDTCQNIWQFLRDNLTYHEESVKVQKLSTPATILARGYSDCKGYSLFIGGILGALNRRGWGFDWCYRYVPSSFLDLDIGHVFVVVEPNGENIWVDPVLDTFDRHYMYLNHQDQRPESPRKYAAIAGFRPQMHMTGRVGSAEGTILDQINQYTLGLQSAMNYTQSSGTFNTISKAVVLGISYFVPIVGVIFALENLATIGVSDIFGPGSAAARLLSDIATNPITAPVTIVESLLNGRTFNSDQYEGARYYYYYVMGNKKYTSANQVSDTQVLPALKWFIDRTGVFISGREHIIALTQGPSQYTALYKVNADTTTDPTKVGAAVKVAQTYFNFNGAAGSWANAIGVYDPMLIDLANQLGESVEMVSNQVEAASATQAPGILSSPWVWIAGGLLVGYLLTMD
jgi:hypothetical protein